MENVIAVIATVLSIICDLIILMLPWMILAAINKVSKSVAEASARRSYEAGKILQAIGTLHDDLYAIRNGSEEA